MPAGAPARIPELDGLRALAVLAVIAFHFTTAWRSPIPHVDFSFGWAGVDLFFVLSGFLITGILLRTRGQAGYYRHFYARRTRRIFPLLWLILAVYVVGTALVGRVPWKLFGMYAAFLTSLVPSSRWFAANSSLPLWVGHGVGVLWTLSVEEWFYLLWAPAVHRWSERTLAGICVAALVGAPLLRMALHGPGTPEYYFFLSRVDAPAWGALVALAWKQGAADRLAAVAPWAAVGGIVAVTAVTVFAGQTGLLFAAVGYTVLDFTCAAMLVAALTGAGHRPWTWLRAPALGGIGIVSYGLYLLHQPIYSLVGGLPLSAVLQGGLALALTLALASLSWRYFESPILNRRP
jgi:peptidoglycan/LPS O-acetylase OafA/YrhL